MSQQPEWLKKSAQESLVNNAQKWRQVEPGVQQKVISQLNQLPMLAALGAPGQQFIAALQQGHEQLITPLQRCSREQLGALLQEIETYFHQSPSDERLALKAILNLFASTLFAAP